MPNDTVPSAPSGDSPIPSWLADGIKFVFSWVILMPVAVIVSGKLLAQRFKLVSNADDIFRIPIRGLFVIEAKNDEVVLGFSGFLLTLFIIAVAAGHIVYDLFKYQFGVDPGQFNSLCVFSSFATVLWTAILYVLTATKSGPLQSVQQEHNALIKSIAEQPKKE